jgi:hypothetical protein
MYASVGNPVLGESLVVSYFYLRSSNACVISVILLNKSTDMSLHTHDKKIEWKFNILF